MAEVTKNTDESRFEIHVDGELAGRLDYRVGGPGIISLVHTEVDDAFAGQGLGGRLVRGALDDIRSQGYRAEPLCDYARAWLGKHPEYADLVATPDTSVGAPADVMEPVTGVDPSTDPRI